MTSRRIGEERNTLVYLSLFGDEIDSRFQEFLSNCVSKVSGEDELGTAALHLEPTDALIVAGTGEDFLIARGGACNFPLYWMSVDDEIVVSTELPLEGNKRLSKAGLLDSVAVVSMTYQNEPNVSLRAPVAGWFRVRRGAISRFKAGRGCVAEKLIDHALSVEEGGVDRKQVITAIRVAMENFANRFKIGGRALVELSGGIDSTLAALAVRNQGTELGAVSVYFPYYEFRFEEDIQEAVARQFTTHRVKLDGRTVFPYAQPDLWPRLDEPATAVISLKRDMTIARLAADGGRSRVLVGQGGDQIFAENLLQPLPAPTPLARELFSERAWKVVEQTRHLIGASPALRRRSMLTYLYDARLDVPMKDSVGIATRSPFTDLKVIRCGLLWAALSARLGSHEGKLILKEAFEGELPSAVADRRGKVCWDGICARAYAEHAGAIIETIERVRDPLSSVGINVQWLVRRIVELARWKRTKFGRDDREVFAIYSLATWLSSWEVERVGDCAWSE